MALLNLSPSTIQRLRTIARHTLTAAAGGAVAYAGHELGYRSAAYDAHGLMGKLEVDRVRGLLPGLDSNGNEREAPEFVGRLFGDRGVAAFDSARDYANIGRIGVDEVANAALNHRRLANNEEIRSQLANAALNGVRIGR